MPRASKMTNSGKIKVFYWPDTGAVEAHLDGKYIVKAQMVEQIQSPGRGHEGPPPLWEANAEDVRP
jgi:hypothetical protein